MTEQLQVGNPKVRGRCPSCGFESLFLGNNGYVTCSRVECKEPGSATNLLAIQTNVPLMGTDIHKRCQAWHEGPPRLQCELAAGHVGQHHAPITQTLCWENRNLYDDIYLYIQHVRSFIETHHTGERAQDLYQRGQELLKRMRDVHESRRM